MVNDAVVFRVLLRCAAKAYFMRICDMRTIVFFQLAHKNTGCAKGGCDGRSAFVILTQPVRL